MNPEELIALLKKLFGVAELSPTAMRNIAEAGPEAATGMTRMFRGEAMPGEIKGAGQMFTRNVEPAAGFAAQQEKPMVNMLDVPANAAERGSLPSKGITKISGSGTGQNTKELANDSSFVVKGLAKNKKQIFPAAAAGIGLAAANGDAQALVDIHGDPIADESDTGDDQDDIPLPEAGISKGQLASDLLTKHPIDDPNANRGFGHDSDYNPGQNQEIRDLTVKMLHAVGWPFQKIDEFVNTYLPGSGGIAESQAANMSHGPSGPTNEQAKDDRTSILPSAVMLEGAIGEKPLSRRVKPGDMLPDRPEGTVGESLSDGAMLPEKTEASIGEKPLSNRNFRRSLSTPPETTGSREYTKPRETWWEGDQKRLGYGNREKNAINIEEPFMLKSPSSSQHVSDLLNEKPKLRFENPQLNTGEVHDARGISPASGRGNFGPSPNPELSFGSDTKVPMTVKVQAYLKTPEGRRRLMKFVRAASIGTGVAGGSVLAGKELIDMMSAHKGP